jgi:hypothetical protein
LRHAVYRPARQLSQRPQPLCASMHTRSPGANSSTRRPVAATVPVHSWPGVNSPNGGVCGKWPSKIFRSVPHVPHMATLTSTSSGPGSGTARSTTRMSSGPKSTTARIISGTPERLPGPAAASGSAATLAPWRVRGQSHGDCRIAAVGTRSAGLMRDAPLTPGFATSYARSSIMANEIYL